ncbi:MAG TPA: MATE family efflux transporter [Spirochaetota bacterium]|nr:MATE family efflux transporter [Spirochaetota bacterium]
MKNSNHSRDLSEKNISSLLWSYFLPAFVGVMANALYNIVGRIFIGQFVGTEALSGLTVVFPVMIIIMGFGMLFGIGSAILISIELGRGNREKAEFILGNGLFLMIISSLFLTIVGFFVKEKLLHSFGATESTIQYANDYLNIILAGTVFGLTGFALNTSIRAEGNARISMNSMLLSAGLNVVFDAIFIILLKMGVKGAGLAAVISQMILTFYVLYHFRSKNSVIKLYIKNLIPDFKTSTLIISSGMAPFIMQIANSFVQALFNAQLIKHGGDIAVAAMGVINSVATLIIMSIVALNMASQPIIGYNFGAGKFGRVKEALTITVKYSTVIGIVAFIIIQIFPYQIISIFNNSKDLLNTGSPGLRIFLAMVPFTGFQIVTSNYFQAIGQPHIATVMTIMRQVVFLIPLLIFLPPLLGITGVWLSAPISDFINAIVVFFLLQRGLRSLNIKITV